MAFGDKKVNIRINAKDNTKAGLLSVRRGLGGIQSAARLAGVALGSIGLLHLATESLRAADSLGKTSQKLGLMSQELGGLRYAAELASNMTGGQFDMALQRMTRRLSEAAQGTGEAKGAIKELGLDAQQLARLSPDAAFREIAEAMKGVNTQSDRVRLAFKLFDSEGVGLVNTLQLGKDGLIDMRDEAIKLGVALDDSATQRAAEANDAITRMKASLDGIVATIAIDLAPSITVIAEAMTSMRTETDELDNSIGIVGASFRTLTIGGLTVKFAMDQAGSGIGAVAAAISLVAEGEFTAASNVLGSFIDDVESDYDRLETVVLKLQSLQSGGGEQGSPPVLPPITVSGSQVPAASTSVGGIDKAVQEQQLAYIAARLKAWREARDIQMEEQADYMQWRRDQEAEDYEIRQEMQADYMRGQLDDYRLLRDAEMEQQAEYMSEQLAQWRQVEAAKKQVWLDGSSAFMNITNALFTFSHGTSRKMFELNKVAGIANATISTYQAAAQALRDVPYPFNLAAAAAVTAQGLAQVANIQSQPFTSGGSAAAGGFGGGTPDSPVVTQPAAPVTDQQQRQVIELHIVGALSEELTERQLIPYINSAAERGVDIKFVRE